MKKIVFIALTAIFILYSLTAYGLTYYFAGNAGCENNRLGEGGGVAYHNGGSPSLEVGCKVQYVFAGLDGAISPPNPATGGVSGDDILLTAEAVGADSAWLSFSNIPGVFYHSFVGTCEISNPKIYVRVWNTSEAGAQGSRYNESSVWDPAISTGPGYPTPNEHGIADIITSKSFDTTPPGPPVNLTATPEADGDILLGWKNTNEADFKGTMIRYSASGYPTNETEGLLFINQTGGTDESRSSTHEGLTWNSTYFYSAFSYDDSDNYSSPATVSATSTDTLPPSATVYTPNGGELWGGGTVHNITWEAHELGNAGFAAKPITLYYSSDGGSSWTFITQEANSGSYAWTVPSIDSTTCRVSVEAVDQAGNVGDDMSNADFVIDSNPPGVTSIEVKDRTSGDTLHTNERTVSLEAFGVSAEAVVMIIAEDAGFTVNSTGWITYQSKKEYELTAGDGSKTVYYKVRDAALNESNVVNKSITLDTAGPTGSISINSGAYATRETAVVLTLTATDEWAPILMNVSNEASFPSGNWEPFSASKSWNLTSGDATKTVYVRFRDGGSNESTYSDGIILDTISPAVTVEAPNGGETWQGGTSHNITWSATDGGSGMGLGSPIILRYSTNSGSSWTFITQETNDGSYAWLVPAINSTTCRVSVEAVDRADNMGSDMSNADFTIDSTAPGVTSIEVKDRTSGDTLHTNERTVSIEAFGVSADAVSMIIAQDPGFTVNSTNWIPYQSKYEYELTAGDGTKTVYYKVRDAISNESNVVNKSITLDTTGPTGSISINSGAYATRETAVVLTMTATDEWAPILMNVSNEASFPAANWEPFSASKNWNLTSGDATKTVYVRFRDGGSNESTYNDGIILDTISPAVTVTAPNGGETWQGGTSHNITWSATDGGSGMGLGSPIILRYSTNSGSSWTFITQEANDGSYAWLVPAINSTTCRVSVEAVDRADNMGSDMSNADFTIDSSAPVANSVTVKDKITGNTTRTNNRTVSIEAVVTGSDINVMRMAEDNAFTLNDSGWLAYVDPTEYTLTAGDGNKSVFYKVRDTATYESNTVNGTIILDTTGPTGAGISISGGTTTNDANVLLTLTATDEWAPLQMMVSNDAAFTGGLWEAFALARSWTLSSGDGAKTVYAKFRDGGYNESVVVSASINLDATAPRVVRHAPIGTGVSMSASIEVEFSKSMDTASVQNAFSINPLVAGTFSWYANNTIMTFIPANPLFRGASFEVSISAEAKDTVGNALSPAPYVWQFMTVADTTAPIIENYLIDGVRRAPGEIILAFPTITAQIRDEGSAAGIKTIKIINTRTGTAHYTGTYLDWNGALFTSAGDFKYTLPALPEGVYDLQLWAEDFAGNTTSEVYTNLQVYSGLKLIGPLLNYPNPFAPLRGEITSISYYLTMDTTLYIYVYDIGGNLKWKYTTSAEETAPGSDTGKGGRKGYNEVIFNGHSAFGDIIGNGIYIVKIADSSNNVLGTMKITVLD